MLTEVFFDVFTGEYSALNIAGTVIDYHHAIQASELPHFYPLVISEVFFMIHILNANYRFITLLAITNRVVN